MTEETGKEILAELKRQTAILSRRRQLANVVVMVLIGFFLLAEYGPRSWRSWTQSPARKTEEAPDSWQESQQLFDKGRIEEAREMIQRLILEHPESDYGYALLGFMYQQEGNLALSETNYAKAVQLLPDEENEKALVAIRKAIANKNAAANKAGER